MIKNHQKVSSEELKENCDLRPIMDEGETPDDFLDGFIAADPESYFAKSNWGSQDCYYIMTSGFEFIFIGSA